MKSYALCGANINGHCLGKYLDHPDFDVVWERSTALDVPIYLHQATAPDVPHVLQGHEELLGPIWGWGVDTGTQALRLIFGKVFDRHPTAKVILGHMGELLPYSLGGVTCGGNAIRTTESRSILASLWVCAQKCLYHN